MQPDLTNARVIHAPTDGDGSSASTGPDFSTARVIQPVPDQSETGMSTTEPFGAQLGNTALEFISDTASAAKDVWTGDGRRSEDLPELPREVQATMRDGIGMLGPKMALARGDLGKLGIFRRFFPDAEASIDQHGNVIVTHEGQRYFLNRPGLSGQDAQDIGTAGLIELPFASAGGRAFQAAGLIGRAAGTGLGVATGSITQDVAAQASGSTAPIDLTTAGIAGLSGGAFEFASPILAPFFRKFLGSPSMFNNGRVTDQGRQALDRLGIDADEITEEFAKKFETLAKDAVTPDDLAGAARQAQADEFGIRLSQGDANQSVIQQGREDAMLKGAYGEGAANTVRGFREGQADDVLQARQGLLESPQGIEGHQGTQTAQDGLLRESEGLKTAVQGAYDQADQARASILKEGVTELARQVRKNFQSFNPVTAPKAAKLIKDLEGFEKRFPGRVTAVKVKALEQYRQQVMALTRSNDGVEAAAAQNIRQSFDEFMEGAIDDALIRGDADAIEMFRKARSLRSEYARLFESDKIVSKVMELEPSEATKYLFGASRFGGRQGTTKAIRLIKEIVGPDSPEWAALREQAFLRLLPDDRGSIGWFANSYGKALADSPELMTELFSQTERAKMARFIDVVESATKRQAGAVNFSNTATTAARILQDVFGHNSGNILRSLGRLLPQGLQDAAGAARAGAAIRPAKPVSPVPPGLVGVMGAASAQNQRPKTEEEIMADILTNGPKPTQNRIPLADVLMRRQ